LCVKELKIAPSESWQLDFIEIKYLLDIKPNSDIDLSLMLNFEREQNGASRKWLKKV